MRSLVIRLRAPRLDGVGRGTRSIRSCDVQRFSGEREDTSPANLWFSLPESAPAPREGDAEPFVVALLMQAMAEGRTLVVKSGAVSHELLSNLTEFRDAWVAWCPEKYSRIDFDPERVEVGYSRPSAAVGAFSGGVDATFSMWRHVRKGCGYRAQDIRYGAVIQGFDIPLGNDAALNSFLLRATPRLARLGVKAIPVSTNFREIVTIRWLDVFAIGVVSCLWQFASECGVGILGSSQCYDHLIMPVGSSPATDHLLTGAGFRTMLDGAGYGRTEKVKQLSEWPDAVSDLRVCWQGSEKDRNCGECEKCLRTMLNFRAVGLSWPSCFPREISKDALARVRWSTIGGVAAWQQLVFCARSNHIRESWVDDVARRLIVARLESRIFYGGNRIARAVLPAKIRNPIGRVAQRIFRPLA
jgi:hypothetical protein